MISAVDVSRANEQIKALRDRKNLVRDSASARYLGRISPERNFCIREQRLSTLVGDDLQRSIRLRVMPAKQSLPPTSRNRLCLGGRDVQERDLGR
jgi:hypothetical protein